MGTDVERRLQALIDKDEIRDVLMRYARGVDRGEADIVASCYHPDAIDDHGGIQLTGTEAGPRFTATRKPSTQGQLMQHFMGNISIDVDGDTAYTETYCIAFLHPERDAAEHTVWRGLRYLDRFEKRNGAWKVAYRVVVDDWDRMDPVTEPAPMREMWRRGNIRELDPAAQFRTGAVAENENVIRERLRPEPAATP